MGRFNRSAWLDRRKNARCEMEAVDRVFKTRMYRRWICQIGYGGLKDTTKALKQGRIDDQNLMSEEALEPEDWITDEFLIGSGVAEAFRVSLEK